jgi:ACS family sodium-dependent inorganic phosphate cotransporter-like MFS transporter 5
VVSMPVSGILCSLPDIPGGGWPLAFYLTGGLGILWFVAWMLLVSDTPDCHPRISESEKTYINYTLGRLNAPDNKVI